MLKKFKYKDIDWIDLESPTKEDIDQLIKDYKIYNLPAKELLSPTPRSRVEVYDDFNYLILHFPTCQVDCAGEGDHGQIQEIDFIVGKNFLITTHYENILALHNFAKLLEIDNTKEKSTKKIHSGILFMHILRELYASIEHNLETINDNLREVEKDIFSGKQKEMVKRLSGINHDLLDYYSTLKTHREILDSFNRASQEFFGDSFGHHVSTVLGMYDKVWNIVETNREIFSDLRQTNESLLTIQVNETIKTLTVLAFVTLPATMIIGLFGTNTKVPFEHAPWAFFAVIGLGATASLMAFILAKYNQWL